MNASNLKSVKGIMNQANDRWDYINKLEDELLLGGVIISEWSAFLVQDAEEAFCSGANLAAILVSQAAIESHLRYEYASSQVHKRLSFYELIEQSPLPEEMKRDLHILRKYRNRWVHVNDPNNDADLLVRPEYYEEEVERIAYMTIKLLLQVVCLEQWV
jgi:hypothetical protein